MEFYSNNLFLQALNSFTGVKLMAKKSGSGLQSSAGLMRYYEADKNAIHIQPKTVMIVGAVVGIAILFLSAVNHVWP